MLQQKHRAPQPIPSCNLLWTPWHVLAVFLRYRIQSPNPFFPDTWRAWIIPKPPVWSWDWYSQLQHLASTSWEVLKKKRDQRRPAIKWKRGSSALHMIPSSSLYPIVAVYKDVIMWVCHLDILFKYGRFLLSVTGVRFPWGACFVFCICSCLRGEKNKGGCVLPFILLVFYSKEWSSCKPLSLSHTHTHFCFTLE